MFVGQSASLSVLLHVRLSVTLTHVFGGAVRLLLFDLTLYGRDVRRTTGLEGGARSWQKVDVCRIKGWCSEKVSCLKRTVSVWLSVLTDAEPPGDVAFTADGPPVERLPLLHSP